MEAKGSQTPASAEVEQAKLVEEAKEYIKLNPNRYWYSGFNCTTTYTEVNLLEGLCHFKGVAQGVEEVRQLLSSQSQ